MLIQERFTVKAPIDRVWDYVTDPVKFSSSVPGCESLQVTGERTYLAVVKSRVGPITVTFKFDTKITELDQARHHMKAVGAGKDIGMAGMFKHESVVDLVQVSPQETEVNYRSEIGIVGRLATFGDRIMQTKAKDIGEKFAQSVREKLEAKN